MIKPQPEPQQDAQPQQADSHIVMAMTSRVGKQGMDVIREILMRQQALFTEQVRAHGDFYKEPCILPVPAACSYAVRHTPGLKLAYWRSGARGASATGSFSARVTEPSC